MDPEEAVSPQALEAADDESEAAGAEGSEMLGASPSKTLSAQLSKAGPASRRLPRPFGSHDFHYVVRPSAGGAARPRPRD